MSRLRVFQVIIAAGIAVFLLLLPSLLSLAKVNLASEVLIYALFAISFNVLFGYSGILPFGHASSFENDMSATGRARSLAGFFKGCLQRMENISKALHIVVHTEPNLEARGWAQNSWQTIADDFHWHIEINPEIEGEHRMMGSQGFYFNPIPAEEAALVLRALSPGAEPPPTE